MTYRTIRARDALRRPRALPGPAGSAGNRPYEDLDALLALAREAGLLVTLDAQIGREKYQSIAGSVRALQRFAAALCARTAGPAPIVTMPRRKPRPGWPRLRDRRPGSRAHLHAMHRCMRACRRTRRARDQRTLRAA
ncbi:hypothetical protein [Burkholderia vietnamiensis]|uniref:hypothetical protein n=1 Tax=Burkholderia vietnamiensis TaxID=60552 RepID=UPI00075617CA|nr:hypothetical protein [Burkholderia vietnamiensis]KVE60916.1 hypothetical protein WI94_27765 [Burkholderia vietnamiensis]KVE86411.1 hypothetical protein WJ00_12875 [Burkholderia vietnamiensis]MDN7925511.1 hypothetical protein [Burkholderia vietnamiensis]HDR9251352.1 hypothetical protein [Burkholderia vietnamiensis]